MIMRKSHIIVDLDGTMTDHSHRLHFVLTKQYDEFHALLHLDPPFTEIIELVHAMTVAYPGMFVLGVTGRNERFRKASEEWFMKHDCAHLLDHILMRPDNDFTQDPELKVRLIEEYFGSKEKALESVSFCLDDKASVVEALRNYGFKVLQVREGDL